MLDNWLKPIDPDLLEAVSDEGFLGAHIKSYTKRLPNLKKTQLAIVGVGEQEANEVRKALYAMSFHFPKFRLADLGNVRREDPTFIIPVVRELLEGGICPIVIGSEGSFARSQFFAHQACQHSVSMVEVSDRIACQPEGLNDTGSYLDDILKGKNKLFHYSAIGCQSHFIPDETFRFLEKSHFDYIRLGKAQSDLTESEPYIRDADMVSFHISALKHADAPGTRFPSPSGFHSEEACQISRYAGMNDKLTSIGFYGYVKRLDPIGLTAQTVAQLIWYFLDGFHLRQKDFPASMEQLTEYIVDLKDYDHQLTFWKSNKTGRWWIQVPVKTRKKLQRHRLIPCSYNDYLQAASQGDLPERLWNAFRRFE